jgi:hypothetical protein
MHSPFSAYQEENAREAPLVSDILRDGAAMATIRPVEPISHRDVTTIMGLIVDIRDHVAEIRRLLEEDNGEEEADEADA